MAGVAVDPAPRGPDDLHDIQALLHAGFATLTAASFLLLRVTDAAAARRWLGQVPVTSIGHLGTRRETVIQVALTAAGMRALAIPEDVIAGFSAEFVAGLADDPARSRRLGDVGPDAPTQWAWGWAEREPHVLVMLYALPGQLAPLRASLDGPDFAAGFAVLQTLETSDMNGHEPFGFLDGVSQPTIDWSGQRKPDTDADLDYGNLITPGEFVLGYRNEYGLLTERPLLDAQQYPQAAMLPPAAEAAWLHDLGRNGSYLVLRTLSQDVRGFWRFMAAHGDPAERIVGRRMDGMPLMPVQQAPIRGVGPDATDRAENGFTFRSDPDGLACPVGAHIRRANPRTGDMPGGRMGWFGQLMCLAGFGGHTEADRVAASRFHRLLRRGREYGTFLPAADAQAPDAPDPQAGLHFICLAANISRQFEFVQNAWLQSSEFAGLHGEADPLTANRAALAAGGATDAFGLPQAGLPEVRVEALPRFVGVRGGAYFFLPGLRALRFLAGVTQTEAMPASARWQEVVSPAEAAQISAFCAQIRTYQHGFARRGDGQVHRGFHV
jgi:deferrochelatase/peroxidase EfeB